MQKTAYEMRISDWSSDVCSSDLADWRPRKVLLDCLGPRGGVTRLLRATGRGQWKDDDGEILRELDGCHDVDISATPFTNTPAIRRLKLKPGQRAELRLVYVSVPSLQIRAAAHRYTSVEPREIGSAPCRERVCPDV